MSVSFAFLLLDKRAIVRLFAFSIVLLTSYCVYLTNSRGGFLAHLTLLIVICNYAISNITFKKIVLVISLCCLVFVFTTKSKDYRSDESAMGRVEAWSAGMSMLLQNPFFGVGKGNFIENHSRDSHSSYVRAGAELGFVGLYVFIGIMFWSVTSLNKIISSDELDQYKIFAVALVSYIYTFMVGSLFSTRTYDILLLIMVAFVSSLVRIVISNNKLLVCDMFAIESFINKRIILISIASVVVWKIFLIQTW
jgi:O-antigen ligase